MRAPPTERSSRVRQRLAVTLLLLGHALWLGWSATWQSPTLNEPGHLASGLAHWEFGRFEPYRVNPPLARMVAALPLLMTNCQTDWSRFYDSPGARTEFGLGEAFVMVNGGDSQRLFNLARWACIPFSLLAGGIVWRWSSDLFGRTAGLLALAIWCLEPNVIAHGQLLTPDMAATAAGLAAGYTFWRWSKQPGWATAAVAGAALGFALFAKFSWVILLALWPLLAIVCVGLRPKDPSDPPGRSGRWAAQFGLLFVIALYVVNLGYAFDGSFSRLGSLEFVSHSLNGGLKTGRVGNRFADTWLAEIPVPLPRQFLLGIDLQNKDFEQYPFDSYLRGEWKQGGWWYYYLYAAAVKIPLGLWCLFLTVVATAFMNVTRIRRLISLDWRSALILLGPAVVLFVLVSSQQEFNHHFRYVLPAFGPAIILASGVLQHAGRRMTAWALACLVWIAASSAWAAPASLAYFNELAGGTRNGHAHLLHSNLDWGQGLVRLQTWMQEHPEAKPLYLAYYGYCDPFQWGIDAQAAASGPNWSQPRGEKPFEPGWYAISVNYLRGCEWKQPQRDAYTLLLNEPPLSRGDGSIYIYHVDAALAEKLQRARESHGKP